MDLLLKNMQTMQEQMKAMQKGQEETCMRLARQSHKDVFKKKGNECQFKANEEVKERLEVAAGYLDRVEAASGKEQLDLAKKEIADIRFVESGLATRLVRFGLGTRDVLGRSYCDDDQVHRA